MKTEGKMKKFRHGDTDEKTEKDLFDMFDKAVAVFHPFDENFANFLEMFFGGFKPKKFKNSAFRIKYLEAVKLILINRYKFLPSYNIITGLYEWDLSSGYLELGDLDQAAFHAEKGHNILKTVKFDMGPMTLWDDIQELIKSREMEKSSEESI